MPLLSFERANQWVPLDFMLKTDKMKLPLHEFSFVKATAPLSCNKCSPSILKLYYYCIGRTFWTQVTAQLQAKLLPGATYNFHMSIL